jgi:hypothetical protein
MATSRGYLESLVRDTQKTEAEVVAMAFETGLPFPFTTDSDSATDSESLSVAFLGLERHWNCQAGFRLVVAWGYVRDSAAQELVACLHGPSTTPRRRRLGGRLYGLIRR